MSKSEHAKPDRSPLRRRLERTIQLAALLFFVVLGSAIYQNVSKGRAIHSVLRSQPDRAAAK